MLCIVICLFNLYLKNIQFEMLKFRRLNLSKKIKPMKDNKSPGMDGIRSKLLMETVEQISIPLERVFNLSLKQGIIPFEWKRQTSYHYLKRVREISQRITDQ